MEYHEAANIFPLDEEHIADLAKDIKANGLAVSIETLGGKIIDGRRRFLACKKAGISPAFQSVDVDDPVTYVMSLNLHRRHLTTSQASACAARAESLRKKLSEDARERQKTGKHLPDNCPEGDTRDKIGAMFGVSGKSVERAKQVIDKGIPELVKAIDAGKISVNKAQYISTLSRDLQKDVLDAEIEKEQSTQRKAKPQVEDADADQPIEKKGVGVIRANEAINILTRIPKNDALRKRGFQIVTDWIRNNR